MAIPESAFHVNRHGATLRLSDIPLCDSFFFGNCQGVASQVSTTVRWHATGSRVDRGEGAGADPESPGAFSGSFSDANCQSTVSGVETGFSFETNGELDASGFFAEFGEQANGVMI